MMFSEFLVIDLPGILSAMMGALSCALIGNFLILRRQSMISDAASHALLPGIVVAALLGFVDNASIGIIIGGVMAAILTLIFAETIVKTINLETGAALAICFTSMFALGVILLEATELSSLHLDVEHALYGNLEGIIWPELANYARFSHVLGTIPMEITISAIILVISFLLCSLFYKELKLISFDGNYAITIGYSIIFFGYLISILTALAAVSGFMSVGVIMVIAMFICPASSAYVLSNSLPLRIFLSLIFALLSVFMGYMSAFLGSYFLDFHSSIAAMIGVSAGIIQLFSIILRRFVLAKNF